MMCILESTSGKETRKGLAALMRKTSIIHVDGITITEDCGCAPGAALVTYLPVHVARVGNTNTTCTSSTSVGQSISQVFEKWRNLLYIEGITGSESIISTKLEEAMVIRKKS